MTDPAPAWSINPQLARDQRSGRTYVAPAGTAPPDGDEWVVARLALR